MSVCLYSIIKENEGMNLKETKAKGGVVTCMGGDGGRVGKEGE